MTEEQRQAAIWPDRLKIRDTGLHDDMGGGGQRIYTTAGRGYEKREYVRADLALPDPGSEEEKAAVERIQIRLLNSFQCMTLHPHNSHLFALAALRALRETE